MGRRTRLAPVIGLAVALSVAAEGQQRDKPVQGPAASRAGVARLLADTSGKARVSLHPSTGAARFIRLPKGALSKLRANPRATSLEAAEARSIEFLRLYGSAFGVRDAAAELERQSVSIDRLRRGVHITYGQRYRGLPVVGGELRFHFDAIGALLAVNGTFVPRIAVDPTPTRSAEDAGRAGVRKVEADLRRSGLESRAPTLLVFQAGLAKGVPGPAHLAWRVEVGDASKVREFVFVDAHTGKFVDQITGTPDGLFRRAYDAMGLTAPGPNYPASPYWSEGDPFPTASTEADNMILASRETYDLFWNAFGRDSFDGAGARMDSIFNRGDACPNASWNGTFISFCPGLTTDDVTGHEWTHAYTEYTDNLIYQWQPGALNEAASDIFGETVDRINGRGGDTPSNPRTAGGCSVFTPGAGGMDNSVRWLIGEDDTAPGLSGALRDMWNPTCYGNAGKVSDAQYSCSAADNGGVHSNSGVDNHAYALMVDGGSYNGQSVSAIGLTKAAHVYFRAKTLYQGPATDFAEHADALEQSCLDLVGTELPSLVTGLPSGQIVGAGDCAEVTRALLAVEMRSPPAQCGFQPLLAPNPPARCGLGTTQVGLYFDDFENPPVGWTASHAAVAPADFTPRDWVWTSPLPGNRPGSAFFGVDFPGGTCAPGGDESGVLHLDSPAIAIPVGSSSPLLTFDHWISTEGGWDGANLSISVNGGAWTLVAPADYSFNAYNATLFTAGQGNTNPLEGLPAFTGADGGSVSGSWGRSHVDLSPYASPGNIVRLRFDVGNDGCTGTFGWYIDDVLLYACDAVPPPTATLSIDDVSLTEGNAGGVNAVFSVTQSFWEPTATVDYATSDLTATTPADYTSASGTLSFASGPTQTITVVVNGDTLDEPSEAFLVSLANPTNATIDKGVGQGTILDDDGRPSLCSPIGYLPFTITSPGYYCLVQNLSFSPSFGAAITIADDDVLIDFKGFVLDGTGSGLGTAAFGIYALNRSNLRIQGGSINGFLKGVFFADDSGNGANSSAQSVRGMRLEGNTYAGLLIQGRGAIIRDNLVLETGGTAALGTDSDVFGIVAAAPEARVLANDVVEVTAVGAGRAFGVYLNAASRSYVERNRIGNLVATSSQETAINVFAASSAFVARNLLFNMTSGIVFEDSTGIYRRNLCSGCVTPYLGGTDACDNY